MPAGTFTVELIRNIYIGLAFACLVVGIVTLVLGVFVRRGNFGATVVATLGSGVILGLVILVVIASLLTGLTGNAMALIGTVVYLVPGVLFGLTFVWLVNAWRSISHATPAQWRPTPPPMQQGFAPPYAAPPMGYPPPGAYSPHAGYPPAPGGYAPPYSAPPPAGYGYGSPPQAQPQSPPKPPELPPQERQG